MKKYIIMASKECQCPTCRKEQGLDYPPVLDDNNYFEFSTKHQRDETIKEFRLKFPDRNFSSADI
jgi:hypothetical protein